MGTIASKLKIKKVQTHLKYALAEIVYCKKLLKQEKLNNFSNNLDRLYFYTDNIIKEIEKFNHQKIKEEKEKNRTEKQAPEAKFNIEEDIAEIKKTALK